MSEGWLAGWGAQPMRGLHTEKVLSASGAVRWLWFRGHGGRATRTILPGKYWPHGLGCWREARVMVAAWELPWHMREAALVHAAEQLRKR